MDIKPFLLPKESLEETDVLCLLGFDEDSLESQLKPWLLSGDKEVFFIQRENPHVLEDFLKLSQKRVFQTFTYLISPFLEESEKAYMKLIVSKCQALEWHTHIECSDYQDLGVKVFQNLRENLLNKVDVKVFSELKGCLHQVPAFICGGGPSLKKAMAYLKDLKNKGVIFAGGAALGSSIPFHIAAGIDPDPSWDRCLMQEGFEAPFFFQERFSNELLSQVQGPLVQAPSHSGLTLGTEISDFDGGCTVTTFCTALALHFGCNPIFFIGMDLAYDSETNKYFQKSLKEELFKPSALYEDQRSQKDWVIAAKWLEHVAKIHGDTEFYTLSENGLTLDGIPRISFQDFAKKTNTPFDIEGKIQWIRFQAEIGQFSLEERREKKQKIEQSLRESLEIVVQILELFETQYPHDPSSQGNFLLQLFALYNQIVYQHLLEPLWKVWRYPLERTISCDYSKKIHQWLFFKKVLEVHLKGLS